ncbi:MAG: hypothetical protein EOS72_03370 [Mesorhizobium sp.]|uniref:hypothetical protein n=1 Tax=Mesorhizobium sp. TaxID=1871066 RepID=UPI000FE9954E|nr:hypothetical protein [Mesorhizobium sp.]RWC91707.1 MAG: hypothetical protein EOS72_03370 [Mesorhizobium sp.]
MTPMIVHRFEIPLRDALGMLVGDARAGSSAGWKISVEEEALVVDLIEPWAGEHTIAVPANFDMEKLLAMMEAGDFRLPPVEPPPSPPPANQEEPPPRKGGPLAQRAGILCNEGAFRLWAEVQTPDAAKAFIYRRCGVESRVDLDHEEEAATKFKEMCVEYQVWLEMPDP